MCVHYLSQWVVLCLGYSYLIGLTHHCFNIHPKRYDSRESYTSYVN